MLTSDEYVAGLSATTAAVVNRPKREDCPRTNHDPAFSEWKTLVGPKDWKEYSVGKEGAERYRTRNLPDCTSCTGVYELGIVASQSGTGKSDHYSFIPVYVGQADNVRNRLQQYGRDGDHLENSCKNVEFPLKKENGSCQKGCRLFTEAFSRGYSIVYRWAPMKSREDAEKTESRLLKEYDYAWNKYSNDARRRDEVLNKAKPPAIRNLQKGFRIKAPEPDELLEEDDHDTKSSTESIPHVFKFEATGNPKTICKEKKEHHYVHGPIIECRSSRDGYQQICGFGLSNGTFCTEKPPEGRKRCEEHKGLRIKEPISQIPESGCRIKEPINGSATCGATLKDGESCCSRKPAEGSRRCWQHNGHGPTSLQALPSTCGAPKNAVAASPSINGSATCGATLKDGESCCSRKPAEGSRRCWQHNGHGPTSLQALPSTCGAPKYAVAASPSINGSATCGATLKDGRSCCSRKPAEGSRRCWQHNGHGPSAFQALPSTFGAPTLAGHSSGSLNYYTSSSRSSSYSSYGSSICGALTQKGYPCSRTTTSGGRCWQHGG